MNEEKLTAIISVENVYAVKNITIETGAEIDETTYRVKLTEENVFKTEKASEPTAVKILMLKGEKGDPGSGGGVGTYAELPDKPAINDITLVGNKSLEDLNVFALTNTEIEELLSNNI